ncbi:NAD(P)-binding protein [Athelia psychrophila]|uniref:NAD(P)-binding protein n=1 Tax=Athelia psychrophila TaxID=1759441 RepID=A0A166EA42_9AGAM|nr:NAD(P)-binding protein [Fibularhizoctonia sp. CBS 109695]
MATPTAYLVSGASRHRTRTCNGLGHAPRHNLLRRRQQPQWRDCPYRARAGPSNVHVVQRTSGDRAENDAAVKEIARVAGRLDIVIANAGIRNFVGPAMDTPEEQLRDHHEVNVTGTHVLLCTTYPLLAASTPAPEFVAISSIGGSIAQGTQIPKGVLAYGASKAALNYLVRKVHLEYPGLICFPMCPGAVATERVLSSDLDPDLMKKCGMRSVAESATAILTVVMEATREKDGGRFVNHEGTTLEW